MIAAERRHTDRTVVELQGPRPAAAPAARFGDGMARIIDRGDRRRAPPCPRVDHAREAG